MIYSRPDIRINLSAKNLKSWICVLKKKIYNLTRPIIIKEMESILKTLPIKKTSRPRWPHWKILLNFQGKNNCNLIQTLCTSMSLHTYMNVPVWLIPRNEIAGSKGQHAINFNISCHIAQPKKFCQFTFLSVRKSSCFSML